MSFKLSMMVITRREAGKYAEHIAGIVNSECNTKDICPERIPSWENNTMWDDVQGKGGGSKVLYGLLIKYVIYYHPSKDLKSFTFMVKHNIDQSFDIYGGVGKNLNTKLSVSK